MICENVCAHSTSRCTSIPQHTWSPRLCWNLKNSQMSAFYRLRLRNTLDCANNFREYRFFEIADFWDLRSLQSWLFRASLATLGPCLSMSCYAAKKKIFFLEIFFATSLATQQKQFWVHRRNGCYSVCCSVRCSVWKNTCSARLGGVCVTVCVAGCVAGCVAMCVAGCVAKCLRTPAQLRSRAQKLFWLFLC